MSAATVARVLFDEAHSEAWTIRPDVAREMQPAHPGGLLVRGRRRGAVRSATSPSPANVAGAARRRDAARLRRAGDRASVGPAWERTIGTGSPRLSADELDAVEAFVERGRRTDRARRDRAGRSTATTSTSCSRASASRSPTTPSRTTPTTCGAPSWILPELGEGARGREGDLLARVDSACLYRATHAALDQRLARAGPRAGHVLGAGRAADRRRSSTATAASSCSPTRICSATTASTSSTTARCG